MTYSQNQAIPPLQTQTPPTIHMEIISNLHALLTIHPHFYIWKALPFTFSSCMQKLLKRSFFTLVVYTFILYNMYSYILVQQGCQLMNVWMSCCILLVVPHIYCIHGECLLVYEVHTYDYRIEGYFCLVYIFAVRLKR